MTAEPTVRELAETVRDALRDEVGRADKRAWEALARLVALAERAEQWQRHAATSDREVGNLRTGFAAVMAALALPAMEPSLMWQDGAISIMRRANEIVDEVNRLAGERDEARDELEEWKEIVPEELRTPGLARMYLEALDEGNAAYALRQRKLEEALREIEGHCRSRSTGVRMDGTVTFALPLIAAIFVIARRALLGSGEEQETA